MLKICKNKKCSLLCSREILFNPLFLSLAPPSLNQQILTHKSKYWHCYNSIFDVSIWGGHEMYHCYRLLSLKVWKRKTELCKRLPPSTCCIVIQSHSYEVINIYHDWGPQFQNVLSPKASFWDSQKKNFCWNTLQHFKNVWTGSA